MVRIEAGKASDFKDGQMKEVALDPKDDKSPKVLVAKAGGKIYATSSRCTHYGASLAKGVLNEAQCRVSCPWHNATFNICTGDIEDAPGLGNLETFKVLEENGNVFVEADESKLKAFSRAPTGKCSDRSDKGVVVVGGGSGGQHFVEEIRQAGYKGKVTFVARDPYLPIDRTKLSKALITDHGKIALRDQSFYKDLDVDVLTNTSVESLDLSNSTVRLSNSSSLPYSHLVLATGSLAKGLPLPGSDLKNIFTLRSLEDAKAISGALGSEEKKNKLVIIGSSFIGMELCNAASKRAEINVVGMEEAPFQAILGKEVGNGIRKFHEGNGVKFTMQAQLEKFLPSDSDSSKVGSVVLKGGQTLPCDLVVLGVGAKPDTKLLSDAGIKLEKDGSVRVDETLKVQGVKGEVYAIGDIATYPDATENGKPIRVEHWNVAGNHGRHVARIIASSASNTRSLERTFSRPAVFWSAQGQQLRFVGSQSSSWEDVYIDGNVDELNFVAYYYRKRDSKVVAVCSMQRDPIVAQSRELFAQGRMPNINEIRDGVTPLSLHL